MIESDHKSPEKISMNNLVDAPVQKMFSKFRIAISQFHTGEEMVVVDILSRYSPDTSEILLEISVNHIYINVEKTINLQSKTTHYYMPLLTLS